MKKEYLKQVWGFVSNICNDRETEVLKKIFIDTLTESEISRDYGVSLSRIGQIKNRAFRRLRSDKDFVQWSRQFDDICAIAYHYSFSSWKYSNTSSVEKAAELEEGRRQMAQRRIERLEQQALLQLKQRFAAAGIDIDF
ncbi:MAG: hypothetical protein K2L19_03830 [Eubacterium sp.]|nr:hypothetical protein [Eubacterium sp.]